MDQTQHSRSVALKRSTHRPQGPTSSSLWRMGLSIWALLCGLSIGTGGGIQCSCPPPAQEPILPQEPAAPEPDIIADASTKDTDAECPKIQGNPCTSDEDCKDKRPPPTKPACPAIYCGADAVHSTNTQVDPTRPGSLPWDRNYYPPREDCECRITCTEMVCLRGSCQPPEPPPFEPPPVPDIPPACPAVCNVNDDCPPSLCQDRIKCDIETKRCINPIVRP